MTWGNGKRGWNRTLFIGEEPPAWNIKEHLCTHINLFFPILEQNPSIQYQNTVIFCSEFYFIKHFSLLLSTVSQNLILKILKQFFKSTQSYKRHTAIHVIPVPLSSFVSYLGTWCCCWLLSMCHPQHCILPPLLLFVLQRNKQEWLFIAVHMFLSI